MFLFEIQREGADPFPDKVQNFLTTFLLNRLGLGCQNQIKQSFSLTLSENRSIYENSSCQCLVPNNIFKLHVSQAAPNILFSICLSQVTAKASELLLMGAPRCYNVVHLVFITPHNLLLIIVKRNILSIIKKPT